MKKPLHLSDRAVNALMDRMEKDKAHEKRRVEFIHKTYFQDGWNNPSNLNYLQKENADDYEKTFSFDCIEMIADIINGFRKHCVDTWVKREDGVEKRMPCDGEEEAIEYWINALCSVLPYDDKAIDYFVTHNPTYALILCWMKNSIQDAIHDKMQFHEILREQCVMEMQMRLEDEHKRIVEEMKTLEEWNMPIESVANTMMKDLKSFVNIEKNPKVYKAKRNQEIVDKAYARKGEGNQPQVYKDIADDYLEISHHMVKKIVFSHDAPTPTKLQTKKQ